MGGKQLGFSDYELTTAKKQTKREKFLSEMEAVVPWQALIDLIEPHYPKANKKGGRPPYPLATMLTIHLLQQWYSLSDPAMEEALIEVPTMRRFAGIELISDRIPDETTILTFRHLLEKHKLGEQVFETVKAHLSARGMTMRQGTIVDATLIAAPSSTKNKAGKRDPEMHQTKKGNQWYHRFAEGCAYGMNVHAGVDKDSGLIHSVVVTAANVHDLTPAAELLHGDEEVVYGDAGYQGIAKRPEMARKATEFRVAMRPGKRRALPDTPDGKLQDLIETAKAHIRSKVEHPFRVIKQQFGFQNTRLRGLAKNRCKIHMLAALSNLFQARRQLLATA
ncbi:IS5 family transposase [Vulcanococcus sp. Clear-D1]|uniref:IS5 family transposase n=1 Tax=Vulcanococcus sp. Clear-D1 TaxID=2766970 RepID=UPI0019973980|nr:IS5 family transposase [Vulcanococcus sp. Clear-D1]MBD1193442.1 IS5 family transposase [Vulcanococcus sp. Clear-D1]